MKTFPVFLPGLMLGAACSFINVFAVPALETLGSTLNVGHFVNPQSKRGVVMNQYDEAQSRNPQELIRAAEHIYHAWDEALGKKDLDAALALYAPDATIESPLVRHLLGSDVGICRGHDDLRRFIEIVFQRTPSVRQRFRAGFFTDGKTLMWEYPRITQEGEQVDLVGHGVKGWPDSAPPRLLGLVRPQSIRKGRISPLRIVRIRQMWIGLAHQLAAGAETFSHEQNVLKLVQSLLKLTPGISGPYRSKEE